MGDVVAGRLERGASCCKDLLLPVWHSVFASRVVLQGNLAVTRGFDGGVCDLGCMGHDVKWGDCVFCRVLSDWPHIVGRGESSSRCAGCLLRSPVFICGSVFVWHVVWSIRAVRLLGFLFGVSHISCSAGGFPLLLTTGASVRASVVKASRVWVLRCGFWVLRCGVGECGGGTREGKCVMRSSEIGLCMRVMAGRW